MAWIESHQTLKDHPKLYTLMEMLGISKAQAIGHLHLFWWWCIDYAPEGLIKHNEASLARAAEWTGDAKKFAAALVSSGFIDKLKSELAVHDWAEFRLHFKHAKIRQERKREEIRQRVQAFRDRGKNTCNTPVMDCNAPVTLPVVQLPSSACNAPVTKCNAPVTQMKRTCNAPVTQCNAANRPYRTVPNLTERTLPNQQGQTKGSNGPETAGKAFQEPGSVTAGTNGKPYKRCDWKDGTLQCSNSPEPKAFFCRDHILKAQELKSTGHSKRGPGW